MMRFAKRFGWAALLILAARGAFAFSLGGPFNEAYQVPVIAYNLPGDIMAPKNLGEEYRRNTPVLYYSFDANFLDYFGSNGVVAVEQAIAFFNALTNVSSYSTELSEFPLESKRINFRAQALSMLDVKSATMNLLIENLGLAEPERYTWTLHDRLVGQGGCPANVSYTVIKRNFDPVFSPPDQLQSSSYVNGTLYTYIILEVCQPPDPLADALEFPVDPLAETFTAVAGTGLFGSFGGFFTSLTRDDIGGLRYLLRTNNMNIESAGADTFTFITNTTAPQLLFTSNLTLLVAQSLTNNAAQLQALFPGLIVSSTTNFFTNVVTTNIVAFFVNEPWAPAGALASIGFMTNRVTNIVSLFSHSFANVVTNTFSTHSLISVLTTNITECGGFATPGTLCTNVTQTVLLTNIVTGDFYIIPTNLCGFQILGTQLTYVVPQTNLIFLATNVFGATNVGQQEFSQSIVTYSTNRAFLVYPVECPTNSVALRQGVERIYFVRRDFDSLLGQFFYPVTNTYILNAITNNRIIPQTVQRVITGPDILFSAQDLATDPGDNLLGAAFGARGINFNANNAYVGLAGPGTIEGGTTFTYNKVGPIFVNFSPFFLDEATQTPIFIWGSFDGSTNAPVIYPNGTSIVNLENQVLLQVSPNFLPDGTVGTPYSTQFTVNGGTPPYTWSLSTGSAALPPGLNLSSGGAITGTPTAAGTFDFRVHLADASGRNVDRPYSITINP
jgi:hypothetical protein